MKLSPQKYDLKEISKKEKGKKEKVRAKYHNSMGKKVFTVKVTEMPKDFSKLGCLIY